VVPVRAVDLRRVTMLADLDLLLVAVFATADDLRPSRQERSKGV
jgi:hypothetical protein